MELDDMKQAWQTLSNRLDREQTQRADIVRGYQADRIRRKLQPLAWGQWMLIVLGAATALWGIRFWSTHRGIWQAMACGIAMQAFGTLSIIFPARVLSFMRAIDYAEPVLEIQRRIARLRAWRVKVEAPVFGVLGSIIWIPAMLMLIQYGMDQSGVNLWNQLSDSLPWLALAGALSLVLVGFAYVLLCKLGRRRWLEDSFAGEAVKHAEIMLRDIAQFERE